MGFNIERADKPFVVKSPYKPSGDQPQAIAELAERIENGENDVVLMGATGTGKTATTAWLIEKLQRPTLIIEPNKTLAAQLCAEFRELMPDNAVSYFVSYYDYYQPEAYIPQTDTYIEKDSNINDDVERLRHQATANLLTRRDCVVVATVSCIYGLGTPEEYAGRMLFLKVGQEINRDDLLRQFVAMQYKRNDIAFTRGTFRVRGDTVEIIPVYEELAVRIEFFGDEIDRISTLHPLTGDEMCIRDRIIDHGFGGCIGEVGVGLGELGRPCFQRFLVRLPCLEPLLEGLLLAGECLYICIGDGRGHAGSSVFGEPQMRVIACLLYTSRCV